MINGEAIQARAALEESRKLVEHLVGRVGKLEAALRSARPFVEAEFERTDDGGYFAVLQEIDEAFDA